MKQHPTKTIHNASQSDALLNENPTGNSFNITTTVVQGPTDDDGENNHGKHGQWRC